MLCLFVLGGLQALGGVPWICQQNSTLNTIKISSGDPLGPEVRPFQFSVTLRGFPILDKHGFPVLDNLGLLISDNQGLQILNNHGFPILVNQGFPIWGNHGFLILLDNHGLILLDNYARPIYCMRPLRRKILKMFVFIGDFCIARPPSHLQG